MDLRVLHIDPYSLLVHEPADVLLLITLFLFFFTTTYVFRFIQIAEESSRSTFQSIESVVGAVLNIAAMLDSTYFALTSSFRAVLGVAANFGRLRGLFSQFWQSFALLRGMNWLFKK